MVSAGRNGGRCYETALPNTKNSKKETAQWKQDRENRKGELRIRKKAMNEKLGLRFRSTWDIIDAAEKGLLPDKIMLTTHPQRWTDRPLPWVKELVWQNVKNVVKRYIYVRR